MSTRVENLKNTFFLSLRPTFFLALLIIGAAALHPCKTSQFLPFLCLISLFLCYNYRLIGIGLSSLATLSVYFITFGEIAPELKIWHGGLFLSVLVTNFITYLIKEESTLTSSMQSEQDQELKEKQKSYEAEIKGLQEELEKWIEEAKQRKIEKVQLEQKIALIQSEIETYLAQKEAILADSFEKRNQPADVLELMSRYEQLRSQFDEKSKVLSQTRQELFQSQGKVAVLEKQLLELEYQFSQIQADQLQQMGKLQEEIISLEELISQLMNPK